MENVQEWIINLNKKLYHYSQKVSEITSEITKGIEKMKNGTKRITYENMLRIDEYQKILDIATRQSQSAKFRLQLAYQMFPQLMDSGMTFANPIKDSENIMIYSDYPKFPKEKEDEVFFNIAGELIKTENDPISKEEYEKLFNETIKQMVLDRKISQDDVSIKVGIIK